MLQIFMEVLLGIFPIFAIIGIGYKLQGAHWFSTSFSAELSRLIMKIALPASIFTSVIRQLDASKLASFGGGLVLGGAAILLSYAAGFLLCRLFKVRHGRRGTFINTFANANTIFIGMPLNLALFGPPFLRITSLIPYRHGPLAPSSLQETPRRQEAFRRGILKAP